MKIIPIVPAHRTENIKYAIRDINVLAKKVEASGKEMLYLNIGDPNIFDFQPPRHMIEAVYEAMMQNKNGYSSPSGIEPAREAIRREAERKGIKNIHDIFVTTGASEAIDICLTALVNEGENVLTPAPGYPLYTAIANKLQAIENPYFLDEENGWQPDIADIESKINDKTKAIVVINPNNPTGGNYKKDVLLKIIELAEKHNLVIFADEIYDKILFDGEKHIALASLNSEVPIITFGGLSKNYLTPGWRMGWGVVSGNLERVADYIEGINKLLRARLSASHPMQWAIAPALDGDQSHIAEMNTRLQRRRDITFEKLNAIPGISCVKPKGAFYAFPRIKNLKESDTEFVKKLLQETGVVIVPGSGFRQKPGTEHFRVVFLPPEKILTTAFENIENFLKRAEK